MIEKRTVIDQIEVSRDGTLQIRFGLLLIEDGNEIDCKWHRTIIEPGGDVDGQIAAVNSHLAQMGKAPVELSEADRLKALVPVVQTADVVASHRMRRASIEAQLDKQPL